MFLGIQMSAQDVSNDNLDKKYTCQEITFDDGNKQMELIGDVHFQTSLLTLNHAEKIVLDTENNNIVVYGLAEFVFDGEISFTHTGDSAKNYKGILRYKLGDKIAYIQ